MANQFLAIDLGTTQSRAVLDLEHRGVGVIHSVPMVDRVPDPSRLVTNWIRSNSFRRFAIYSVASPSSPEASNLLICNQMHSGRLTDRYGARALEGHYVEG